VALNIDAASKRLSPWPTKSAGRLSIACHMTSTNTAELSQFVGRR
jgi:hypothetical protein